MKVFKIGSVVLILLGICFPLLSQNPREVEIKVSLDREQSPPRVVVDPETVEISVGDRVAWISQGTDTETISIEFSEQQNLRGPFPESNASENRERGRYRRTGRARLVTRGAVNIGNWKYSVKWTDENGNEYEVDPVVSVRRGG